MILCLVFFYLLGGSTATNSTTNTTSTVGAGNSSLSKSIMCYYKGDMMDSNSELLNLEAKDLPSECEVIIYSRFSIDKMSVINVDEASLKSVVELNKPVLVVLQRDGMYTDWSIILGPDGNAKDTKVLCDFAKKNKISGYIIDDYAPRCVYIPFNENVGKFIIPYLKQLKCSPDFIIGLTVEPYASIIKNPCIYNFAEMNDLVTFYEIRTVQMNSCNPKLYNGQSPITKVDHGANYMLGMEEVASFLKESKICFTKIAYDIDMSPNNKNSSAPFDSYLQVCKGVFNISNSCVQTTTNFYDKGKFALEQDSGVIVKFIDLDDITNDCGCSTTFPGFKNIIAGLRGGPKIPCPKFDVQSTEYKFK